MYSKYNNTSAIVGAGIGGLAAAIRLATAGMPVTVYDTQPGPGGKAYSLRIGEYRFDTGPSLLTLPSIFRDLFAQAGDRFDDRVELVPLTTLCTYRWGDGTTIRCYADRHRFAQEMLRATGEPPAHLYRFLRYCRRINEVAGNLFLYNSIHDHRLLLTGQFWRSLVRIFSIDPLRSMHKAISSKFDTPQMRQFFDRFATYNGSDPYRAPATFNIIPYIELTGGAYAVRGGIYDVPRAMECLARRLGVQFRYNREVRRIIWSGRRRCIDGIEAIDADGRRIVERCDVVISNADVGVTYRALLRDREAPEYRHWRRQEPSSSVVVFYWGMRCRFRELSLHNIIFSDDYRREFSDIFQRRVCPDDPTIYINIGCRMTPEDAPPHGENWFVLVNAPYDCGQDWTEERARLRTRVVDRISSALGRPIERDIVVEECMTPPDIERATGSSAGSLYGIASNSIGAAFGRHSNRSRRYRGLYFCGGGAHPGGGLPLAAQSGILAADLALQRLRRN